MGWWPFTSSSPKTSPETSIASKTSSSTSQAPLQSPQQSEQVRAKTEPSPLISQLNDSKSEVTPDAANSGIKTWQEATQALKPMVWPTGVSPWPAFAMGALFLGTVPLSPSKIPGLTPRLARLAFGGAFATAGSALRSGDQYNGASIATWWSLSHVILASLTRSYRKEMAKRLGKPLPPTSPLAHIITLATVGTGLAYGITI